MTAIPAREPKATPSQGWRMIAAKAGKPADTKRAPPGEQGVWSWLSSHPDTVERATELERGHAPRCAAP